jgi:hypothetical protein
VQIIGLWRKINADNVALVEEFDQQLWQQRGAGCRV